MSIGGTLAEARQAAGLSVGDVSARTRIRAALIRAIEADDFAPCGGDFYARGHIRAIARVVGADSRPLIAEYDAARQEPAPGGALEDLLTAPGGTGPGGTGPENDRTENTVLGTAGSGDLGSGGTGSESTGLEGIGLASPMSASPDPASAFGWRPRGRDPREPRSRERRSHGTWLPWLPRPVALLAVIALAVIAGGAYRLAAGSGSGPRVGPPASQRADAAAPPSSHRPSSPTATPPATHSASPPPPAVTTAQVKPSDAAAVGPGGDGGDNPDLATKALAGDASSPWHTHWYTTADFGNLQSGTGLLLTLPNEATVTGVTVKFGDSGGTMQVKTGTSPGSLHTVTSGSAGGTAHLSFAGTSARYVELWFTRLGTDNGANQVSVYDVSVSTASR